MPVSIEVVGAQQAIKGFAAGAASVTPEIRDAMTLAMLTVESEMRSIVPRDTGQLGNSITSGFLNSGPNPVGIVGPSAVYWPFVEYGTRPHWPPIAAITPWAVRHGIPPFVVARSIARRGTRPHPFVAPALARARSAVEMLFARIGINIAITVGRGRP